MSCLDNYKCLAAATLLNNTSSTTKMQAALWAHSNILDIKYVIEGLSDAMIDIYWKGNKSPTGQAVTGMILNHSQKFSNYLLQSTRYLNERALYLTKHFYANKNSVACAKSG